MSCISSPCVSWNGPVSKAPPQLPLSSARGRHAMGRRTNRQTRSSRRQEVIQNARERGRDKTAPWSSLLSGMRACTSLSPSEERIKAWRATAPLSPSLTPPKCFSQCLHILKITAKDTRHPKIPGLTLKPVYIYCDSRRCDSWCTVFSKMYCYRLTISTITTYQEVNNCKMHVSIKCDYLKWLCVCIFKVPMGHQHP